MGATRGQIMGIFMTQGLWIGVIGILLGLIGGLSLSYYVTEIVNFLESLFGTQFLDKSVYLINFVPSEIRSSDVWGVTLISLILSWLATIYPAYKAASIEPAEALRYE
ncbi:MAG: FtsX-like permease family protein, partial [Gammaproteobacteria bacterium]